MEHKQRILFITPVKHLSEFYNYALQNYEILELVEPTYEDVKIQLPNFDILFCAPNHQTFVIEIFPSSVSANFTSFLVKKVNS